MLKDKVKDGISYCVVYCTKDFQTGVIFTDSFSKAVNIRDSLSCVNYVAIYKQIEVIEEW